MILLIISVDLFLKKRIQESRCASFGYQHMFSISKAHCTLVRVTARLLSRVPRTTATQKRSPRCLMGLFTPVWELVQQELRIAPSLMQYLFCDRHTIAHSSPLKRQGLQTRTWPAALSKAMQVSCEHRTRPK